MRRAIAVGVVTALLGVPGSLVADPLSAEVGRQSPSLSQIAPLPWHDAGADGYRVVVIAVGAVVGVIAANFLSGGMITPLLTLGAAAPTAAATAGAAVAPSVSGAGLGMGALLVAAPAAMATMGMITPPLTLGVAAPTAAAAAGAAVAPSAGDAGLGMGLGMGVEMSFMAAAPTAMASIGAPVDAALRDGYTTPTVLLAAFGESAKRAGAMILQSGASTLTWLTMVSRHPARVFGQKTARS